MGCVLPLSHPFKEPSGQQVSPLPAPPQQPRDTTRGACDTKDNRAVDPDRTSLPGINMLAQPGGLGSLHSWVPSAGPSFHAKPVHARLPTPQGPDSEHPPQGQEGPSSPTGGLPEVPSWSLRLPPPEESLGEGLGRALHAPGGAGHHRPARMGRPASVSPGGAPGEQVQAGRTQPPWVLGCRAPRGRGPEPRVGDGAERRAD